MKGVKNMLIDAKLHDASLEVNAKIAEQASILCLQYGWDYERAKKYVLKMNPNFEEHSKRGFIKEKASRNCSITSCEAGMKLAEKTKKLMRSEKLPFDKAHARVYEKNPELVKIYAYGD
jgi:hypothetical protein